MQGKCRGLDSGSRFPYLAETDTKGKRESILRHALASVGKWFLRAGAIHLILCTVYLYVSYNVQFHVHLSDANTNLNPSHHSAPSTLDKYYEVEQDNVMCSSRPSDLQPSVLRMSTSPLPASAFYFRAVLTTPVFTSCIASKPIFLHVVLSWSYFGPEMALSCLLLCLLATGAGSAGYSDKRIVNRMPCARLVWTWQERAAPFGFRASRWIRLGCTDDEFIGTV